MLKRDVSWRRFFKHAEHTIWRKLRPYLSCFGVFLAEMCFEWSGGTCFGCLSGSSHETFLLVLLHAGLSSVVSKRVSYVDVYFKHTEHTLRRKVSA